MFTLQKLLADKKGMIEALWKYFSRTVKTIFFSLSYVHISLNQSWFFNHTITVELPRWLTWESRWVKNPPAKGGDAGDVGLIPRWGRSFGVGNGNPFLYSCLENSMDRGAWQAIQYMGSQRVGLNWDTAHTRTLTVDFICMYFNCYICNWTCLILEIRLIICHSNLYKIQRMFLLFSLWNNLCF